MVAAAIKKGIISLINLEDIYFFTPLFFKLLKVNKPAIKKNVNIKKLSKTTVM